MLKTRIWKKQMIAILFWACCTFLSHQKCIFAHEGHDHWSNTPITIKRSTVVHLQSLLESYDLLYKKLIEKDIQNIPVLAQNIMDAAQQGVQTENKGEGRYMMEHIFQHAISLKECETLENAKESLGLISRELFPFFIAWPMQLKENKLRLYHCKNDEKYWFQAENSAPNCPYAHDELSTCIIIEEVAYK
ncbi:MAG: hypothetical protein K8F34_07005 [Candidatus Kuenenia stuttgartiensis]|jgi:hypothetical protein|uniref:Uncharacterized protein n=1 Tax=Kuenenia stuttgartiensis TaxID=174633 RepID=Q1Q0F8_KUEST|nr:MULTISPECIES: hypothetical protein [Kuenenia]MBZ0191426.1 hypothetical protein [Candidatus Kuenenia stuttgartiensis]MCF6153369.1 hypothetical protein [Candidatus Kuenenia stuttgartiensis]MCL4727969.1 hypothetical protein [Candidatus Kuenenia stuttgartiensis]MCZ7624401.1 hypothetical protein [Candidatus Kuenenia sp.]TVL97564.1 MAG: hypothetical protein CV080_09940 [Candidatus Kuenenia stuttgartiensis]